jgi:putative ABC transport system ATP-binding protein
MITGIDRPSSGKILIDGTFLQDMTESQFSVWRGRNLGIVFQFFQLLPMLSLLENTILPMDFCNMHQPLEREDRALELLRMVGLQDFSHKLPAGVSSGQEQCAAIARALANDPPILVADEPTGNLDSKTAEMVLQILDELVKQGKTILVVTHDEAVAQRASRTLVISDGELVDENISRAFPNISHRSMLKMSHQTITLTRLPGEPLFPDINIRPGVMIILEGKLKGISKKGDKLLSLKAGDILTHSNFLDFDRKKISLHAGEKSSLKYKVIPEEDLLPILSSSKSLQAVISQRDAGNFLPVTTEHKSQKTTGEK